MNGQQKRRIMRALETVNEYLIDKGIGLFMPMSDATQPEHLFIIYKPGIENEAFGNVPDVYDTLKEWIGDSVQKFESDDMRTLCIPVKAVLSKRKAAST